MLFIRASPLEWAIAEKIFNYVNDDAIWPRQQGDSGYMGGFTYLRVASQFEQQMCVNLVREIMLTYNEVKVLELLIECESVPDRLSIAYQSLVTKGAVYNNELTALGAEMLEKFNDEQEFYWEEQEQ